MGKIRRVGVDTTVNYTLLATSAYDPLNPAGTTAAWSDTPAMDQEFNIPIPPATEVTAEGVLISFARMPEFFTNVKFKIRPSYDHDAGEDPQIEIWTRDEVSAAWNLRRRIQINNPFSGIGESDQAKTFDLAFGVTLQGVDRVWITMNPGINGTPVMRFAGIQLFGFCTETIVTPGDCEDDPTVDCIDGESDPPLVGPLTCEDVGLITDPLDPDNCLVPQIDGPKLPPADGGPPTNRSDPPTEFPAIDLCSPEEIAAYKLVLTPEQLAFFEQLLEASDLPCLTDDPPKGPEQVLPINVDPETGDPVLPGQPIEIYIDPNTMQPAPDPRNPDQGPGDQPSSDDDRLRKTFRYVLTWSGNDEAEALALVTAEIPEPPGATGLDTVYGNYGPDSGVSTEGVQFTPAPYGLRMEFGGQAEDQQDGLPPACLIGIRVRTLRLRGAADPQDSVSDAGIHVRPGEGSGPDNPDWELSASDTLVEDAPELIGDDYKVYSHKAFNFRTNAWIEFLLPRVNAAQNDALIPDETFLPRSQFGFQRGGCLVGLTAIQRARWLHDVSTEDYDASGVFDYIHVRPYIFVIDVTLRSVFIGQNFGIGHVDPNLTTVLLTDAQPVEDCS